MDLIKSVIHRMYLLEDSHKTLDEENYENDDGTSKLDLKITTELEILKSETKSILEECDVIRKAIFQIGSQLRNKVPKQELNQFDSKVQEWPLEEFMIKRELAPTFQRYSKR